MERNETAAASERAPGGYTIIGRLCGWLCGDCQEPLSNVTVRLYRPRGESEVTARAVASAKETFAILTDEMVQEKAGTLLAETTADAQGNFRFVLGERERYGGEAFEVDVYCGTVPHLVPGPRPPTPLQFSITTVQPSWREGEGGRQAAWEHCLPSRNWCAVRARFGAWTICGHLTSCEGQVPIPGATVKAFDRDWIQDDPLGSALTDGSGHFRIDYTAASFQKTPFSPLLNLEWVSGPDLYFSAEMGGQVILSEDPSIGRSPGRQNVGPCFCVDLCADVLPSTPDEVPHWQQLEDFDIHPAAPSPASAFSTEGFAGGLPLSYVFGGNVRLRGNCPLRNISAPADSLQYRFLIGEWTWPGPEDPTTPPSIPPATLTPVKAINPTLVGYVFYTDALSAPSSADVFITSADLDPDGWVQIDNKSVTVDMHDGTSSTVPVTQANFLRTFELMNLNSNAVTALHPLRLPGGLDKSQAGRSLTNAEKEPTRRYQIRFEVRDPSIPATIFTDVLSSVVLDNTPVVVALNLEELLTNACNPISGGEVHILYTVDHPHLRFFNIQISSNAGTVHPAPPLPNGAFFPPGDFSFRGGSGGPHVPGGTGGFAVNVSGDPPCAYRVAITWQARHYTESAAVTEILYCK